MLGTGAAGLAFATPRPPKGILRAASLATLALPRARRLRPLSARHLGTLDAIERDGRLRVGFTELGADDRIAAQAFVERLEAATGATAAIDLAPMETQISRLEDGELDLLIGEFREDLPWTTQVAVLEPLSRRTVGKHRFGLSPVTANGENRWIALVERELRDSHGRGG